MTLNYSDREAAQSLVKVVGESRWEAVALAHGYLSALEGTTDKDAAKAVFKRGPQTLKRSEELIRESRKKGFLTLLTPRKKTGSAENPITKMFPATITEQRFLELMDNLCSSRKGFSYSDDRETGHSLTDFTLKEDGLELPINIKNAGTRFEKAQQLVGLEPEDCIPIPAYKANAALEVVPNLLYVVSVDYDLVKSLNTILSQLFSQEERIVWDILNKHTGTQVRNAEDLFIFSMVRKYWKNLKKSVKHSPFHAISARKAVRILQVKPKRTPGIGLRAWGTGASAEVNIHVSIKEDTTPWTEVSERVESKGVKNIIRAVNRKRMEEVFDPEI